MSYQDDKQLKLPNDELTYHQTYFARIESLFAALRGRAILLSPGDYQLAKQWFEKNIPLSCVLRGIREAFYKKMADDEWDEDAILSLSWCKWAVTREWKAYKQTVFRETEPDESTHKYSEAELETTLESITFDLRYAARGLDDDGRNELAEIIDSTAKNLDFIDPGSLSEEELEKKLNEIEALLLDDIWQNLEEQKRKAIEKSIKQSLKKHADNMNEEDYDRTFVNGCRRKLVRDLGLPHLSLYSL